MTMKAEVKRLTLGLILFFGSVWGGSFLANIFPIDHWSRFPIFMTTICGMLAGVFLFAFAWRFE